MKNILLSLLFFPLILFAQQPAHSLAEAKTLIALPLHCVETEFPNKLSQTLKDASELGTPRELHPTFYGCFDWHSAVHGYWTIVNLLKEFPALDSNGKIKMMLLQNFSQENITKEIAYFQKSHEYAYERT